MFFVIGGANIDLYCKSDKELILKDSNPCKMSFSFGGVARNVVENLRNLNEDVSFVSAFGDDYFADGMIKDLERRDVDLSFSIRCSGFASSTYMAILNENDMFIGMNDMSVISQIKKENIDFLAKYVNEDDYVFIDTNLDHDLIEYILNNVKGIKVSDAISANKAVKLQGLTNKLSYLKMNLLEAKALSQRPLYLETETIEYMKDLVNEGTNEVLITGKNYLYVATKDGVYKYTHDAYREKPVNVSGAGDALIAYYMSAKNKGLDTDEACKQALIASVLTVDDENAVRDMNVDTINKEAQNINITKENY